MKRVLLVCVLVCLPLVAARAAEVPIPPPPARWATDTAGFMSPQALQAVDRSLENFERATGNQVLVWIGETTGDAVLEDWTVRAFARWKVGRKGLDNGLVLFVFAKDRQRADRSGLRAGGQGSRRHRLAYPQRYDPPQDQRRVTGMGPSRPG